MVRLFLLAVSAGILFQGVAFADNQALLRQISSLDKMIQKLEQSGETGSEKKIERLKIERSTLTKLVTPEPDVAPAEASVSVPDSTSLDRDKPDFPELTAAAWMELGENEQLVTVEQGLFFLKKRGLKSDKGSAFYERELRRVLGLEPRMKGEPFLGILAFLLHVNEPDNGNR